jgi:hypothetical protein
LLELQAHLSLIGMHWITGYVSRHCPKGLKSILKWVSIRTGIGRLKIGVNVGNTISAGFRSHNE